MYVNTKKPKLAKGVLVATQVVSSHIFSSVIYSVDNDEIWARSLIEYTAKHCLELSNSEDLSGVIIKDSAS